MPYVFTGINWVLSDTRIPTRRIKPGNPQSTAAILYESWAMDNPGYIIAKEIVGYGLRRAKGNRIEYLENPLIDAGRFEIYLRRAPSPAGIRRREMKLMDFTLYWEVYPGITPHHEVRIRGVRRRPRKIGAESCPKCLFNLPCETHDTKQERLIKTRARKKVEKKNRKAREKRAREKRRRTYSPNGKRILKPVDVTESELPPAKAGGF